MVKTLEDIQRLVLAGETNWKQYGDVTVKDYGMYLQFNYNHPVEWNPFERMSRGLIINKLNGLVVARPFDKFFNWFEQGRRGTGHIVSVTEKVDGSLGILYHDAALGINRIATRGNLESEQATWATHFLHRVCPRIDEINAHQWTYLFEIVYPENRIVVDYGDQEELVLLAARNIETGEYMPYFPDLFEVAQTYGFELPAYYQFNNINELIDLTNKSLAEWGEGVVAEFSDGTRWKFKTDEYVSLHRIITSITPKNVLKMLTSSGFEFDSRWLDLPQVYLDEIERIAFEIEDLLAALTDYVDKAWHELGNITTSGRKHQAGWIFEWYPDISSILFLMLDGKDRLPAMYAEVKAML